MTEASHLLPTKAFNVVNALTLRAAQGSAAAAFAAPISAYLPILLSDHAWPKARFLPCYRYRPTLQSTLLWQPSSPLRSGSPRPADRCEGPMQKFWALVVFVALPGSGLVQPLLAQ